MNKIFHNLKKLYNKSKQNHKEKEFRKREKMLKKLNITQFKLAKHLNQSEKLFWKKRKAALTQRLKSLENKAYLTW